MSRIQLAPYFQSPQQILGHYKPSMKNLNQFAKVNQISTDILKNIIRVYRNSLKLNWTF